jgi:hypothetical protein
MINVLRLLTLGGPRTWDANMYQQVGARGRQTSSCDTAVRAAAYALKLKLNKNG